jgi:hypothetical protein
MSTVGFYSNSLICYPKKMDEFGVIQTVTDNMKPFSKQQIDGAT